MAWTTALVAARSCAKLQLQALSMGPALRGTGARVDLGVEVALASRYRYLLLYCPRSTTWRHCMRTGRGDDVAGTPAVAALSTGVLSARTT